MGRNVTSPLPCYPALYEINTRVVLRELGPQATFDDLPDAYLDRLVELGFDIIWMLGVWQTGPAGRQVSRSQPDWRRGYLHDLPDLKDEDICGSPFAVQGYTVHSDFGGDAALTRLRQRLADRGLRLLLDCVPNHVALDHPWTQSHPEYFIAGSESDLAREPNNFVRVPGAHGPLILAHGRDPYFPGWPDTLQLNYRHPGLRAAMRAELFKIAGLCDGVRCDMAMLLLPDVFLRTWGDASRPRDGTAPVDEPFWPEAIRQVRESYPEFLFLAEVYWDLEWALQQEGFDYTYDKRLYDRLRDQKAGPVRAHLSAPIAFQRHCARFLENHDEPRAAAVYPPEVHQAAAILSFCTPGLRFFHEGQLEGRRTHVSIHLARRRVEPVNADLQRFYGRLLEALKRAQLRSGDCDFYPCRTAWPGNPTGDQFLAFGWASHLGPRLLAVVNYGPTRGQCYVPLPLPELRGKKVRLSDLLSTAEYEREGDDLVAGGLYLDLWAWGYHLFEVNVS
jgi:hypothetical protein